MKDKEENEYVLYALITELEKIGCFEIGTTDKERKKIGAATSE